MIEFFLWAAAGALVLATLLVHYETMNLVSDGILPWAQRRNLRPRHAIVVALASLMLGHIVEIWIFAAAMLVAIRHPALGGIQGNFHGGFGDCLYLSSVNYTSLGDNNMRLVGPVRVIAAAETLAGMTMIGWSASFTYLKMEQLWKSLRGQNR